MFKNGLGLVSDNLSGTHHTELFSLSQHHPMLVALRLGVEPVEFVPSMLPCQVVLSLCRSCAGSHIIEIPWVLPLCQVKKTL